MRLTAEPVTHPFHTLNGGKVPAVFGGAAGAVAVFPASEFSFSRKFLRGLHTTEPEMIGAGIDFTFAARANDVARTILVVAKKRATPVHTLFLVRLGRIEW